MKSIVLEGTERKDTGSKFARQLRREGSVPCTLYGGTENVNFYAPYNSFLPLVYSHEFFTITVKVGGKEYTSVIKEIQFHPVTDRITHIDFLELVPSKKIKANIPVKLEGLPAGVRSGGKLLQKIRKLTVKALPKDLVEQLEVNVDKLEMGKSIKVGDLSFSGIEILNPASNPVASVVVPRAMKSAASGAEATPAGAEAGAAEEGAAEGGEAAAE